MCIRDSGAAVYTPQDGAKNSQPVSLRLFTVQIESNDAVVAYLREVSPDTIRNQDYEAPMSPVLLFLVNLLPFLIILLVMSLGMGWMAKKGMGGMGGIGGCLLYTSAWRYAGGNGRSSSRCLTASPLPAR